RFAFTILEPPLVFLPVGIHFRAHKMQLHARPISHHPTVVPRRDVEHVSGLHLNHSAVIHRRRRPPRNHYPHVFHVAALRSCRPAHMHRPFPARLVGRPANRHPAPPHHLASPLLKAA